MCLNIYSDNSIFLHCSSVMSLIFFRTKVKTVTFLLPVDDIYTNRPVLTKHQDGPKVTELDSITETDS